MMQGYISKSLEGLEDKFIQKYRLTQYTSKSDALICFGMYNDEDFDVFMQHTGSLVAVWQGMDARGLQPWKVRILQCKKAKHYAISHWIQQSLNEAGVINEYFPISATSGENISCPRGESVYFYSSDLSPESAEYYGEHLIPEIKSRVPFNIIRATWNTYTTEELQEIYKQCFVGLRLTAYDGCPNGVLEMGLMGRRTIFNGNIPHAIKWNDVDDICEKLVIEYQHRRESNNQIAVDTEYFINLPNQIFNNL